MARSETSQNHFHTRRSVHELTERNVSMVSRLEQAARQERTAGDHVAEVIAKFCGSITFIKGGRRCE